MEKFKTVGYAIELQDGDKTAASCYACGKGKVEMVPNGAFMCEGDKGFISFPCPVCGGQDWTTEDYSDYE